MGSSYKTIPSGNVRNVNVDLRLLTRLHATGVVAPVLQPTDH